MFLVSSGVCWRMYSCKVRTGPEKPGKSWNLMIRVPGIENLGISVWLPENHGNWWKTSRLSVKS